MNRFVSGSFVFAVFLSIVFVPHWNILAAQKTFKIEKASKKYDLIVKLDSCDEEEQKHLPDLCTGPGHVELFKKGEGVAFQTIDQDSITLEKVQTAYELNQKPRDVYDSEYSLIFDDFNFDGEEDLAICNGRSGGYGAASYTIYLFEKRSKKFVENEKLSDLADGVYLGLFFTDPKRKRLHAFWKSGAGYHVEEIYSVINDRPVLVEKMEQEATVTGLLIVTTQKRINGKWVKAVRTRKINWPNGAR